MATQYREPNPYARRLAAHALERLSLYFLTWLDGGDINPTTLLQPTPSASSAALTNGNHNNSSNGGGGGVNSEFGSTLLGQFGSTGMGQLAKEARGGLTALRLHSVAYGPGQRLCFAKGEHWREAVVLRPPDSTRANHLLRVHIGPESYEEDVSGGSHHTHIRTHTRTRTRTTHSNATLTPHAHAHTPMQCHPSSHTLLGMCCRCCSALKQVDLDAHPHCALPLYAYAVGCPLRLLSPRGAWEECIIVDRAPHTNQHVVRMPPVGNLHWTLLVPWNHVAMPLHSRVPLFGVRPHDASSWVPRGPRTVPTAQWALRTQCR